MSTEHDYYRVICRQCGVQGTLDRQSDNWGRWSADLSSEFEGKRLYVTNSDQAKILCKNCQSQDVEVEKAPFRSA